MIRLTPLAKLRVPLGGQEIELQQIDYDVGGMSPPGSPKGESQRAQPEGIAMSLLRTRIREKSRFTVFDIDPQTAEAWGDALLRWAQSQTKG